jgi:hypothetical protein
VKKQIVFRKNWPVTEKLPTLHPIEWSKIVLLKVEILIPLLTAKQNANDARQNHGGS